MEMDCDPEEYDFYVRKPELNDSFDYNDNSEGDFDSEDSNCEENPDNEYPDEESSH